MNKKFKNSQNKIKGRIKIKIHKIYSRQRLPLLLKIKMSKRNNNKCKIPDRSFCSRNSWTESHSQMWWWSGLVLLLSELGEFQDLSQILCIGSTKGSASGLILILLQGRIPWSGESNSYLDGYHTVLDNSIIMP